MEYARFCKQSGLNRLYPVRWAFDFESWNPTESELVKASSCIQTEEKQRIGRFVYKKDAKASLIGRLMMRKYVADTTGIPYNKIIFDRDDSGKPYLANDIRSLEIKPYFNVSHQGRFTVLAGELSKWPIKLGVDVMKLEYSGGKGLHDFFRIMSRQFSEEEWKTIKGAGENDADLQRKDQSMLSMFCRHWCLKESYVKATGTGITVDLQQISFNISTDKLSRNVITSDSTVCVGGAVLDDWIFEESLIDGDHCVAVALCKGKEAYSGNSSCKTTTFNLISFNEILTGCSPLIPEDLQFCKDFLLKENKPV